jgi:alkanesulfonate monooxygenase SsuD/methylene tetrahydromethanopterin reductase-like flavin-dependent oxidoreductase (luciferase family)
LQFALEAFIHFVPYWKQPLIIMSSSNKGVARMRIGIGLPSGIAGAQSQLIFDWAKRADAGPFSSLGVIDRLAYDSFEPLTTLAAVAAITQRVKLATTIVIGPLHNDALLAKAAATVDALSRGRLVLGLAVGARHEDYEVASIDYRSRGKRLTEQLMALRSLWEDSTIGPKTARQHGPDLLIGGLSDQGYARMARYADGYVHGGGPPRVFARGADKARAAWRDMGRPGKPQIWAQAYFALGDEAEIEAGHRYMREYYSFAGPVAERIASWMLTTPQEIAQLIRGYEEAGCDELVLFPTIPHFSQIERLADALVGLGRSAQ